MIFFMVKYLNFFFSIIEQNYKICIIKINSLNKKEASKKLASSKNI